MATVGLICKVVPLADDMDLDSLAGCLAAWLPGCLAWLSAWPPRAAWWPPGLLAGELPACGRPA